jgi:hypothetical protein
VQDHESYGHFDGTLIFLSRRCGRRILSPGNARDREKAE